MDSLKTQKGEDKSKLKDFDQNDDRTTKDNLNNAVDVSSAENLAFNDKTEEDSIKWSINANVNETNTNPGGVSEKKSKDEKSNRSSNLVETLRKSTSAIGLSLSATLKASLKDNLLLDSSKTVKRFSPLWRQSLAATASILVTFTAGLTSGYSAILLPQLKHPGSPIPSDVSSASWIASMAALPMGLGCLISGWIMERFGRRMSHIIICVPFLLGWVLIYFANGLILMLMGRFFTGICVGLLGPLGPVYIGETTDPSYRGFFLAGVSLAIAGGLFIAHLIGTFLTWQSTALICGAFPIISAICLCMVPESPTWLISKGRTEDGIKAFTWLRGYDESAVNELRGIIEQQERKNKEPPLSLKEKIRNLKNPELIKPLVIMIIYFVTAQFSGVNAVAFYSVQIMQKTLGGGMDDYVAMLTIDLVRVVMSVIACVLARRYGRRPLTSISGTWTALSLFGLSIFLYCTRDTPAPHLSWIPLTCLISYICAISVGIVPLPWIMCGEIFPTRVRGMGSGVSSAVAFTSFFVVVKTSPSMMTGWGEVLTFLFYGLVSIVGTIILFFILPETKGKSLQEIEDKFKNVKSSTESA